MNKPINQRRDRTTKTKRTQMLLAAALVGAFAFVAGCTSPQTRTPVAQSARFEELANLPFPGGSPTKGTAQTLKDELLFQRATQTYIWALPAIMTLGMQVGSEKAFGAGYNVLPIWRSLTDAKTLVVTPNTVTMYAVSYLDLGQDGPLVVELPPNLQGFLSDYFGVPIPVDGGKFAGDVGLPGPDGGKGGKCLLLPPGYKGAVPKDYFVYRSATHNVMVTLRGFVASHKDLAPSAARLQLTKMYPLNGEANAKPMIYPDASSVPVNMLPIADSSAFDQLKRLLDREGEHFASPDWLGMLASIGIAKGQPFNPDARTRKILEQASETGFKTSRVLANEDVVNGVSRLLYPDRNWTNPFFAPAAKSSTTVDTAFMNPVGRYLDLDARADFFTMSWGISPGMVSPTPGTGAFYGITAVDSKGNPLSGGNNYRLHLPANVPVKMFWSVTLYDAYTTSLIENGRPFPSLGSPEHPVRNSDGSTDLYVGPSAPEGKAGNWLPTKPGKDYIAIIRLYGPTEAALDKSWKPADFELVK